jgi:serine protease Do
LNTILWLVFLAAFGCNIQRSVDSSLLISSSDAATISKDLWKEHGPKDPLPEGVHPVPSLAPLIKFLRPGVVNVYTTSVVKQRRMSRGFQDPFEEFWRRFGGEAPETSRQSLGSGFIVNEHGYVITNNHVVENATEIRVKLADGREFGAEITGKDPQTDVALLKLKSGNKTELKDLPITYLGDSDALEVGDYVIAVGNPFGLDHSVSQGIVSAKERFINATQYDNFIQTDAAINPGNSGGPLFNSRGEVVGVNTAIVGQGIGFAVPINMVKTLLPQLLNNGKVVRGWLGVSIQDVTAEMTRALKLSNVSGALVAGVVGKSPADVSGIRAGDVVVGINGKKIKTYQQLSREIAFVVPGSKIKLELLRNGKSKTIQVTIGQRPDEEETGAVSEAPSQQRSVDKLGIVTQPLSKRLRAQLGITHGIQIAHVDPSSPAARTGALPGDIIVEIQRQPVLSVSDYQRIIRSLGSGEVALLRLQRESNVSLYVAIRVP